ncbi:c-type cytochrome biogenesis protein CcsB [Nocardioides sp.]|uniref:c-type cytochrome biogenesis protein CcsB n=1 Tax=Nocardioides sp. TaxID=35761 RepID=UPI002B26644B|nr:c-type cytochrome biogenesis protein CcsB [Nocardioides sp.]
MTDTAWETLSNQAIGVAGIFYFIALMVHLAEWASLRAPKAVREAARSEDVAASGSVAVATGPAPELDAARSGRVDFLGRLGVILTAIAAAAHFVSLLGRGLAADPNRVPWGNMYEFTVSGAFFVTLMYLVLLRKYGLQWMAPIVTGFVVSVLMVAVIWLHSEVAPLTEALDSYWLVIHVVSAVIATGAFTLGGIASMMYLVKMRVGETTTGPMSRVPSLAALDRTAYRVHAFAFPVWTFAVLITGPIWAHEAWSRYWNWDPKEVWAFITWVVYAAYLHARATAGWKGRNAAILALIGLATLWFNFIGINYFSTSSQHSYALEAPVTPAVVVAAPIDPGVPLR